MPDSIRVPLSDQPLAGASNGQVIVATGAGTAPIATDTLTTAKTFSPTSLSDIPLTVQMATSSTGLGAINIKNLSTSGSDVQNRSIQLFTATGPSSGTLGTYAPSYFVVNSAFKTQCQILISGNYTVQPDGVTVLLKDPGPSIPYGLGIWGDTTGSAMWSRLAPIGPPYGYQYLEMNSSGVVTMMRDENSVTWVGGGTAQNSNGTWPSPDAINPYKPAMTISWGFDNASTPGWVTNGRVRAGSGFLAQSSSGNQQSISLNNETIYSAAAILGSSVSGTYSSWLFVQPGGGKVGIGNNGFASTAQLSVRQTTNTTDCLSAELTTDAIVFKVNSAGKTQIGASGTPVSQIATATASLSFPSIGTGTSEDLTIGVTGATTSDGVTVTPLFAPTSGALFAAWVGSAGNVTVRYFNSSGGNLAVSGTFRVEVRTY